MTVYIVNQFALRPVDKGSLRHFYLSRYLVQQGHKVKVCSSNIMYNSREDLKWTGESEFYDGVEYICISAPKFVNNIQRLINHLIFAIKVYLYLWKNLKSSDVVIGSTPQPFSAYFAYLIAKKRKAKFVYEVRDLWPQTLIDLGGLKQNHPMVAVMRYIERTLATNAYRVITLMPLAWQYYVEKYQIPRESIVWIPQGVEVVPNEAVYPTAEDSFEVLYAGTLGLANRTEMITDVCKHLQDLNSKVVLKVFGDGPLKAQMLKEAEAMNLKNLKFMGTVPRKTILAELKNANAALALAHESPLYKYGISYNKLADYFLSRRPVIFIGNVAMNPVAEGNAGLVITSSDGRKVAEQIAEFASQKSENLRKLGENGFGYLLKFQDVNVTGAILNGIVQSATGRNTVEKTH